uniref:LuxR family transcriptional regulator n=1 Tax=Proteiniborus sp. TaxID=2079015 RepID=UPI003321F81B
MNRLKTLNARRLSVAGFSFLFAYILSFQFEGQVLYSVLDLRGTDASGYILAAIITHFTGLFTCGLFVRSQVATKSIMLCGMCLCLLATVPFFFTPSVLWATGLIIGGYASGCTVAAWGYFLRVFTPKNERIKSCADVLIYSNLLMIAVNVVAMNRSPFIGLGLSMLCLVIGTVFIWLSPVELENEQNKILKNKTRYGIKNPLLLLCLFVFIITINSGLMYEVINPAFEHLTGLVSWYWAVPYILALAIMRNLPMKAKRSRILYVGMAMIMGAFISFMLLGRNAFDYLIVDTLMLGACGIFDLFWWSILGEMLDYTDNLALTFGIGLSANVFGVLCGGVLGMVVTSIGLPGAEVAVIALTVVCVTLVMLPSLNRQLVLLLKSHAYLAAYDNMS